MAKLLGPALPNIPWEDRPAPSQGPVWRYSGNPIIQRNGNKRANSVFNSAVVPFRDGFAGVFRCDSLSISMDLFAGFSPDGIHWKINDEHIPFEGADPEIAPNEFRYDARITQMGDRYYITWCNGYHGPTIGVAWTEDFQHFHQLENAFLPFNRNGVLFPRKDRRAVYHGEPPQRQRPHPLRRYVYQPIPRSGILGAASVYDGHCEGQ